MIVGLSESYVYRTYNTCYHDDLGATGATLLAFGGATSDHAFRAQYYKARGWRVHAHPVVYAKTGFDEGITREAAVDRLHDCAKLLGPHIDSIDIVNEPLHFPHDSAALLHRDAAVLMPRVSACCNEFDLHWVNPKLTEAVSWCGRMNVRRIGIQLHAQIGPSQMPTLDTLRRAVDRLAASGVSLWFSEVSIPSGRLGWTEALQSQWIERLFTLARDHPAVDGFTYWDVLDQGAWNHTSGLVREDGSVKPAYTKLKQLIRGQLPWWRRIF